MELVHFLIGLAVAAAVIASVGLSRLTGLPLPVFLVPAGVGVSYVPALPDVILPPDVVFYVFLPPLLYSAAFVTSPREWRANWLPISALAVGLVIATLFAAAAATAGLVGGMSWAAAFVLGAVVSPTDPVAATGVVGRLGAPARLRTILEGESLVNDGVALVVYALAVTAALSGSYSILHGVVRFVETAAGGIAIGVALGWVVAHVRRRVHDPMIEITISLVTPYLAYLPAEQAHVSGILATVTTGVYLGARSEGLFRPQTRVQALAFWEVLVFLLESTLFVLLGAQFPVVVAGLGDYSSWTLVWYALLVFAVVALVRLVWQFTVPHFVRALDPRYRELRSPTPWQERFVLGWGGMRGAVTLAAALAIPRALPGRHLVLFLSFCVILATIVVQGTTLPWLVSALGLARPDDVARRELRARVRLAEAALGRLDRLASEDGVDPARAEPLRRVYEDRIEQHAAELDEDADRDGEPLERIQLELVRAQRKELGRLERAGGVDRETGAQLRRELDLEESRIEGV